MSYTLKTLANGTAVIAKSVFGKKKEYELNKESDGCWYVDFPKWPFGRIQ